MNGIDLINPHEYHEVSTEMRGFFCSEGLIEVPVQHRLSILAACEDPTTLSTFDYSGQVWPLPQTGQMWLEYEILKNSSVPGYFCFSTSYRSEPNPVPGRHNLIFPMIEFEIPKNMNGLVEFVERLLDHFGYNNSTTDYPRGNYLDIAAKYETKEIGHEHEMRLYEDYGNVFLLQNFPEHTSPFWNMKRNADGTACKMDIIMSGIETIGSAERSTDVQSMTDMFYNISNGLYATTLNSRFGSSRVKKEFEEFINSEMVVRSGGGIGVTRLIRSLKMSKLMVDADTRSDTS